MIKQDLGNGLYLVEDENGLSLVGGDLSLRADFSSMLSRIKKGKLGTELIVKAARIKHSDADNDIHYAVDATAGFGEDSFLLAAAGYRVILFEYNPVIAALLEDAMKRALEDSELAPVVSRMELRKEDSITGMSKLEIKPDVVLLDPMFPGRTKSALIKKKFQLLQKLESPCSTEEDLLEAAVSSGAGKILIKRPLKGPFLAGVQPSHSYKGKAIRYDVIVRI